MTVVEHLSKFVPEHFIKPLTEAGYSVMSHEVLVRDEYRFDTTYSIYRNGSLVGSGFRSTISVRVVLGDILKVKLKIDLPADAYSMATKMNIDVFLDEQSGKYVITKDGQNWDGPWITKGAVVERIKHLVVFPFQASMEWDQLRTPNPDYIPFY